MQWEASSKRLEICKGVGRKVSKDLQDRLDWQWLRGLLHGHAIGGVSLVQLQIGGPGSLLPASYQPHDRLLVQVGLCKSLSLHHLSLDIPGLVSLWSR